MDVEIILHQHDFRRIWKMRIGQIPEHVGIIDSGVAVGDLDMPPAFQRREHHEQIGNAIAFVFVIVTRWLSKFGGDRRARVDDQLLRGFVEAHERALRIVRSLIDFQDVFHGGDKRRVGVGRNHPLLLAMRLENVFLASARSCCRWRARQCAVRQPSPRADAGSIWQSLPGPERASARSVLLPPRRRKSAAGRSSSCICGPTPPRTLPRPAGAWSARQWRCWCPAPRRSGCRSSLRPHPIRPPSTGCAPSSAAGRNACLCELTC